MTGPISARQLADCRVTHQGLLSLLSTRERAVLPYLHWGQVTPTHLAFPIRHWRQQASIHVGALRVSILTSAVLIRTSKHPQVRLYCDFGTQLWQSHCCQHRIFTGTLGWPIRWQRYFQCDQSYVLWLGYQSIFW